MDAVQEADHLGGKIGCNRSVYQPLMRYPVESFFKVGEHWSVLWVRFHQMFSAYMGNVSLMYMFPGEYVLNSHCNDASWSLPVANVIGLLFVTFLVWFPINAHPLWKSILYFMQIVPLVTRVTNNWVMNLILAVFQLVPSQLDIKISACLWTDMTAVLKLASDFAVPLMLVAICCLMLAIYRGVAIICNGSILKGRIMKERSDAEEEAVAINATEHSPHKTSQYSRYTAAFVGLVLVMYKGVTGATMNLLYCVQAGEDLVIYRAGTQRCYVEWQYALFVLLICGLAPFSLILIGVRWFIRKRRWHESDAGRTILDVLKKPYSLRHQYWESVGIFRRLVLLSFAIFVPNAIWSAVCLFFGVCDPAGCANVLCSILQSIQQPSRDGIPLFPDGVGCTEHSCSIHQLQGPLIRR